MSQTAPRPRSNIKTAVIWVPLGYSPVMNHGGPFKESTRDLKEVLGEFDSVRFHTQRLGEQAFRVSINRKDALVVRDRVTIDDSVSGLIGDILRLKQGQTLTINSFDQSQCTLELSFWHNL